MRESRDDAFTLIELLIVMVIIGILAAIAVPIFLAQRQSGYDTKAKSDVRGLATQEELHLTNTGTYGSIGDLQAAKAEVLVSSGVTVSVVRYNGSTGFCLSAKHSSSSNTWFYDSRSYGLQSRGANGCPATTAGTVGDSLSG